MHTKQGVCGGDIFNSLLNTSDNMAFISKDMYACNILNTACSAVMGPEEPSVREPHFTHPLDNFSCCRGDLLTELVWCEPR